MGSILRDQLDYSKQTGQSYRVKECDTCVGMGNSYAVQITRKPDGFLWSCHRCRMAGQHKYSGFFSDTGASPREVQQVITNASREKKDTRPEVVSLPDDFTKDLVPKAAVQLYDFGITDEDMDWFDVGWSQAHKRIIFPLYTYIRGTSGVHAKKLIGFLGRKLADDDSNKPKWWSIRQRDIKHPRFIGLPRQIHKHQQVVLVEDILSAIRISQIGVLSIALLTTYLPYEMYPALKGWDTKIWLDSDAYTKSVKYQATLGQHGLQSQSIYTDQDPKCYNKTQIEEAIENGKL